MTQRGQGLIVGRTESAVHVSLMGETHPCYSDHTERETLRTTFLSLPYSVKTPPDTKPADKRTSWCISTFSLLNVCA